MTNTVGQASPDTDDPIIPEKTPATATPPYEVNLEIVRYYTEPKEIRALEPFVLTLEVKNFGTAPALGWRVSLPNCEAELFMPEDSCDKPLPTLQSDELVRVTFRLRYIEASSNTSGVAKNLVLRFSKDGQGLDNPPLYLFILPARVLPTETVTTVYQPFQRPKLVVHRTWTAKARSRIEELLTEVPLMISATVPGASGGPEFEVVVEIQNQGALPAHNIYIDFCAKSDHFDPIYAGCRKQIPITLEPGGSAIASQTMAYNNDATPTARGDTITVTLIYEFKQDDRWLREELTDTVYLYPQFFPAVTPIPLVETTIGVTGVITADLVVNTPILNVRTGPGTAYPVVGVAYQGARFVVTGKAADWWRINFNGVPAWVWSNLVIARAVDAVRPVADIPAPPPPTPALVPNRDPVGLQEQAPTVLPVALIATPPPLPASVPAARTPVPLTLPPNAPLVPAANWLQVSDSRTADPALPLVIDQGGVEPLVVIEHYETSPAQLQWGEPFLLSVVLRNAGATTARQLLLNWQGTAVVPVGSGAIQALADLPAGATTTLQAHFVIQERQTQALLALPLQLAYLNTQAQMVTYAEQLTLLNPAASSTAIDWPSSLATPASPPRALWARILWGLLGLGAEE